MKKGLFAVMVVMLISMGMVSGMACRYSDTYNDKYITVLNYYGYPECEDADSDGYLAPDRTAATRLRLTAMTAILR